MSEVALRKEQEIFDDLSSLCRSPGYVYALAALCFRDTVVGFADEMKAEDMANMFSMDRLIRTELTTLMGLMIRGPIDFTCPDQVTVFSYLQQSEELLAELHQAILLPPEELFDMAKVADPTYNPFANAASLREPIFYGAESAYTFQYRDFAAQKYAKDSEWLVTNRGIDISTASVMLKALTDLLNGSLTDIWHRLPTESMPHQTLLDGFTFTSTDLAEVSGLAHDSVKAFLEAFTAPELDANPGFTTLASFNAAYAFPLIRKSADQYILLQHYGITEAIYETPFYWMGADKAYMPIAFEHRGDFTEDFSFDRLSSVFGADRVFKNVEIFGPGSSDALGEIDVLVLFGDQAIVLQCKSKKLTLKARHGNDLQLREDFKAAVQDAVDQAMDCSRWLKDVSTVFRCLDGTKVVLNRRPTTIYPISVVSDHYPALTFQAKQFLEASPEGGVLPPLVFDIFALDAIAEMLDSPLRLLSYLRLRTKFDGSFNMSHEHIILGYHLRLNLWRQCDIDMIWVADDFAASLDIAMAARRDGVPGARTPDGILTRFASTHFARLIAEMEQLPDRVALDIGFFLLELSEETVIEFNNGVEAAFGMTAADGRHHDFTIGVGEASAGLSVHVSNDDISAVESRLHQHCKVRKYRERAADWYGIALRPDGSIKLAAVLTGAWKYDYDLQTYVDGLLPAPTVGKNRVAKVGRNDPCHCRSGKKFKRCHGR